MNIWQKKTPASGAVSRVKPSKEINFRRFNPFLWIITGIVFLASIFVSVDYMLSQPVTRVIVNGEFHHVVKDSISDEVVPYLEDGFVMLDLDGIRQQLLSRPWIYEVNVSRKWPNEIAIIVTEQTPIARWGKTGFLNHRGDFFEPENPTQMKFERDLPLLSGPRGSTTKVMGHFSEWRRLLEQKKLNVYELSLEENGGWSVIIGGYQLNNRVPVVLGSGDVMEKMRRFINIYNLVLLADFNRVDRIDMRYSNGLAIAWRDSLPDLHKTNS